MTLYRDEGIVLRTHKLGEADRIVVLLTAAHGKVRAVAKGVRRTKSRLGGRMEPPSALSLLLYRGRELDIVSQAETLDHFPAIHEDLGRVADALALVEAVDQVAGEGEPNPALFRMLFGALRTLERERSPLLVAGFYWKLLGVEGLAPVLDRCVRCSSTGVELVAIDPVEGGALCRSCRRGMPLSADALALTRQILGGELAAALALPPGPASTEVAALATAFLEAHLERRLRAVRVFDRA